MESSDGLEKAIFKTTAFLHTGSSEVTAVECLVSEGFFIIGSSTPIKIPLRAIEAVSVERLPPISLEAAASQPVAAGRCELTYLGEGGKRWLTVLDIGSEDSDAFIKILQAENIQVNTYVEPEAPVIKPSFRSKVYLPTPGWQFEITEINIDNGFLTVSSAMPFSIPLGKIESSKIITTKIRTGKQPDDIPLLMKTVELSYATDTGEKRVYSFGIDVVDVEILVPVLEAEKINVTREERVDVRLEYAGFWRRFLAVTIDGIILNISSSIIFIFLAIIASVIGISSETEYGTIFLQNTLFIANIGSLLYYLFFWVKGGQTPGKMAMSLKIVTRERNNISFGRALLRYFGYLVSSLMLGIGYLWIAWDKNKQGIHDKIAGTYVIKV